MNRIHHIWHGFEPDSEMNKSSLGLLRMMGRLEGGGQERISISELARCARHSVPAVSQKIRALADEGFLEREGDPKDRRVCYVRLTDRGRTAATDDFNHFMRRMDSALSLLDAQKVETLLQLLHELGDALARLSQKPEE